ncbi:hypothetical protein ACFPRL_25315 [Pseudoclavibacter helvolus]
MRSSPPSSQRSSRRRRHAPPPRVRTNHCRKPLPSSLGRGFLPSVARTLAG